MFLLAVSCHYPRVDMVFKSSHVEWINTHTIGGIWITSVYHMRNVCGSNTIVRMACTKYAITICLVWISVDKHSPTIRPLRITYTNQLCKHVMTIGSVQFHPVTTKLLPQGNSVSRIATTSSRTVIFLPEP